MLADFKRPSIEAQPHADFRRRDGARLRRPDHVKQLDDDELGWLDQYLGDKAGG